MKARTMVVVAALLATGGVTAACAGGGDPGMSEDTRAAVAEAGDTAAMTLVRTLGGRLNAALANGGPAEAVAFCSGEAQTLTDSVSQSLGPGWEVKRTTLRTRNPKNAPDSLEAEALEYFAARQEEASPPSSYVQRTPAGSYRYYMPLRIGHMCLECHGEAATLDPAVREVLSERYPLDQATGYHEGDFRGVVRVTVPPEAVGR